MTHSVAGLVVFESDSGKKIAGRYFDHALRAHAAQAEIEKSLIAKAGKSSAVLAAAGVGVPAASDKEKKPPAATTTTTTTTDVTVVQGSEVNEIILVDPFIVLLRLVNDVLIAVIARDSQNDLLLSDFLSTIHACMQSVCAGTVSRKKCYDRLDQVFLIFDEAVETGGGIIEFESAPIVARINMNSELETPAISPSGSTNVNAAVRDGIAAISRGDASSLRNVFAGAAQSFSSFLGR